MLSQIGKNFGHMLISFAKLIAKNKYLIFCTICNVILTFKYFEQVENNKARIIQLSRTQNEWNMLHRAKYDELIGVIAELLQKWPIDAAEQPRINNTEYYDGTTGFGTNPDAPYPGTRK